MIFNTGLPTPILSPTLVPQRSLPLAIAVVAAAQVVATCSHVHHNGDLVACSQHHTILFTPQKGCITSSLSVLPRRVQEIIGQRHQKLQRLESPQIGTRLPCAYSVSPHSVSSNRQAGRLISSLALLCDQHRMMDGLVTACKIVILKPLFDADHHGHAKQTEQGLRLLY
jgi:hypothetical protein